jgi:hypothetical protein
MIAIYWFIIAFFLQRELDGRMAHCNQTKLKLIDKRSQVNYEILIQTIVISFHDGLHSLDRLTTYFVLPEELKSALLNRISGQAQLQIKKNTISAYPHSSYDFWFILNVTSRSEAEAEGDWW